MIRINGVPDALDYSPASWNISVVANRPNSVGTVSARKVEASVYGYTDVTPGMVPAANGMQVFGFIPTYVITDMRHDTKTPVINRTLFAIAAAAEAAGAGWYRQSLVPPGTEEVNNIWALRRFVDPAREYEQGNVPSIEPPANELSRDMEMDTLIHPRMFSVVMDIRIGDQKAWFTDEIVGLSSNDPEVRGHAEAAIIDAADRLTNGQFIDSLRSLRTLMGSDPFIATPCASIGTVA